MVKNILIFLSHNIGIVDYRLYNILGININKKKKKIKSIVRRKQNKRRRSYNNLNMKHIKVNHSY